MGLFKNNKRPVETFIVVGANSALPTGATTLNNFSTGAVNLADGQIGVFDATGLGANGLNTALTATDTVADSPAIQIIVGNANSANPSAASTTYPLYPEAFHASSVIDGNGLVIVNKQLVEAPTYSIWTIGEPGGTGAIVAADNTNYAVEIVYRGAWVNKLYGPDFNNSYTENFETPDYTTLSTAEPEDHLIQNLTSKINHNSELLNLTNRASNEPVIALAIGPNGASDGTAISSITAGDVVPVISTAYGTKSITIDANLLASIVAAASDAGLNAAAEILTINTTTAGTTTGGVAEAFLLIGTDRKIVFEDRIPEIKTRLQVGLKSGFDYKTVYHTENSKAFEGEGQGRALNLWYKATHGQRRYSLSHEMAPIVEFPSPIDENLTYVQYLIQHIHTAQVGTGNIVNSPKKEIVLIPSTYSTAIASWDALVGPWAASANGVGIVSL
ncbi:MAG: hypothetical protein KC800_05960 [Candidatus Eremiobacteraeota bacterium]|nr:hypothetical protein [Candidatus Eremiobacteraeota bacterium]